MLVVGQSCGWFITAWVTALKLMQVHIRSPHLYNMFICGLWCQNYWWQVVVLKGSSCTWFYDWVHHRSQNGCLKGHGGACKLTVDRFKIPIARPEPTDTMCPYRRLQFANMVNFSISLKVARECRKAEWLYMGQELSFPEMCSQVKSQSLRVEGFFFVCFFICCKLLIILECVLSLLL